MAGFEISLAQAKELVREMDQGRSFKRSKLEKWVFKNANFLSRLP